MALRLLSSLNLFLVTKILDLKLIKSVPMAYVLQYGGTIPRMISLSFMSMVVMTKMH